MTPGKGPSLLRSHILHSSSIFPVNTFLIEKKWENCTWVSHWYFLRSSRNSTSFRCLLDFSLFSLFPPRFYIRSFNRQGSELKINPHFPLTHGHVDTHLQNETSAHKQFLEACGIALGWGLDFSRGCSSTLLLCSLSPFIQGSYGGF